MGTAVAIPMTAPRVSGTTQRGLFMDVVLSFYEFTNWGGIVAWIDELGQGETIPPAGWLGRRGLRMVVPPRSLTETVVVGAGRRPPTRMKILPGLGACGSLRQLHDVTLQPVA